MDKLDAVSGNSYPMLLLNVAESRYSATSAISIWLCLIMGRFLLSSLSAQSGRVSQHISLCWEVYISRCVYSSWSLGPILFQAFKMKLHHGSLTGASLWLVLVMWGANRTRLMGLLYHSAMYNSRMLLIARPLLLPGLVVTSTLASLDGGFSRGELATLSGKGFSSGSVARIFIFHDVCFP